jgi:hypothetical protein
LIQTEPWERVLVFVASVRGADMLVVKLLKAGYSFVSVGIHDNARIHGQSTALMPRNLLRVFLTLIGLAWELRRPAAIPEKFTTPPVRRS